MEVEARPVGVPFDGSNTQGWGAFVVPEPGLIRLTRFESLIRGVQYHWRVRWRYDPATTPWMPASRWVTMPWNGWNEADLRSRGSRIMLPSVLRDYD